MKNYSRWNHVALVVCLCVGWLSAIAIGQNKQMIVYGQVRFNADLPPAGTVVRILRADLSIARTAIMNPDTAYYSANIFSSDGLSDGDALRFRILFPSGDSIIARTTPDTVVFTGVSPPYPPPVRRIDLWNNHPPVITSVPVTTAYEDSLYRYAVAAEDPDGDALQFRLITAPSWLHIDTLSGVLSGTPSVFHLGYSEVVVEVTDAYDGGRVRQTFTVHVLHTNHAPYFTHMMPDTTLSEGATLIFQYTAGDKDRDSLLYSLVSGPSDATISSDGLFSWSPDYDQSGTHVIVVGVSDGGFLVQDSAYVTVLNVNRAPLPVVLAAPKNFDTLQLTIQYPPIIFTWSRSSDPDGDSLSYVFSFSGPDLDTVIEALRDTFFVSSLMPLLQVSSSYRWTVVTYDGDISVPSPDTFYVRTSDNILSVDHETAAPFRYALLQNYPNPFNPTTAIGFTLQVSGYTTLNIYDAIGREVATVVNEKLNAGGHTVMFNAERFPSGIYFYRLRAGNFAETKKMVLVK